MMIIDCLNNFKLEIDDDGIVISDARATNVKVFSWEEIVDILKDKTQTEKNKEWLKEAMEKIRKYELEEK